MTPPRSNKTDNWYQPDNWQSTPSEKRLAAINISKSHMSKKDRRKTTNIMKEEEVEALRSTFKKENSDCLNINYSSCYDIQSEIDSSDIFKNNDDGLSENDIPTYKIYKDKDRLNNIFDVVDESHKIHLHSKDKDESDMIAVEPKNASKVRKIQVGVRTWWLRLLQLFNLS